MICEKCGKEFFEDWRIDKDAKKTTCRFCSRSCACSFANNKIKILEKKEKKCFHCGKIFLVDIRSSNSKKTLCKECKTKKCLLCGERLDYRNKKGICYKCISKNKKTDYEYVSEYKKRLKQLSIEYKGGKCEICGYDKCYGALEFHHINPKEKDFNISCGAKKFEKIKKELDKCILLCSNCHREIHEKLKTME